MGGKTLEYHKSKVNNYGYHPSCKICEKVYREANQAKALYEIVNGIDTQIRGWYSGL